VGVEYSSSKMGLLQAEKMKHAARWPHKIANRDGGTNTIRFISKKLENVINFFVADPETRVSHGFNKRSNMQVYGSSGS